MVALSSSVIRIVHPSQSRRSAGTPATVPRTTCWTELGAYEAQDVPRVPYSLHEAIDTFKDSKVAREAFGDFVFEHLLNTAVQEQVIFDNTTVTDWELARYFERG